MKKLILLILFCVTSLPAFAQLSQSERDFAIKYLQTTHQNIVKLVSGLSDEQWSTQPDDGGWSVANCLEHILVTEATFWGAVQQNTGGEKNNTADFSANDGTVIGNLANRGTKVTTAPPFEPSGKWNTKQEMLHELKASRERLATYLKSADADLRSYKMALPFGELDMYQVILVIGAHSQRHTFQMNEVLAELSGS